MKHSEKENFEAWDDYIEWKAFHQAIVSFDSKIKSIQNGHFTLA